jgi:cytochrome b involved in lipid metabolism
MTSSEVKKITREELRIHNRTGDGKLPDDVWVLVGGKVYDLSKFWKTHPGGPDIIEEFAGKDGTKSFTDAGHPGSAKKEMESYLVGEYVEPKSFTKLEELSDHNQQGDLWLLIHNKIYDVSKFKHPGK